MLLTMILLAGFSALSIANPLPQALQDLQSEIDASVAARDIEFSVTNRDIQNATLNKRQFTALYQGQRFATAYNNFWVVSAITTNIANVFLPHAMVQDAATSIVRAYDAAAPVAFFLQENQNVKHGLVTLADGFALSWRLVCENSQAATRMLSFAASNSVVGCALEYMTTNFQSDISFNLLDINAGNVVGTVTMQVLRMTQ